ncbi:MAG: hypothetical protein SOZ51_06930 [Eubacteriales bacterium]|nr:hypothetical protein [Eubacteriales bacterium]
MKKTIPILVPIVTGLFGGWFAECFLNFCSIIASPFANLEEPGFLVFCGICSLVSALLILTVAIANAFFLIELDNRKKARLVLIAQACVTLSLFAVSLRFAERIIHIF